MFDKELSLYWDTVLNTIKDGLMIVDREGIILFVNQAFETITGYSTGEIVGSPCSALKCDICDIARDEKGAYWCVLFRTGSLHKRRCTLETKDGRYVRILKNASLLRDAKGNVIGAVETLTDITEVIQKEHQIEAFQREIRSYDRFHGLLGSSAAMQRVFSLIASAKASDAPVIIFGESGTGKELAAEAIHETGARKRKPFVKVNCAALNESLLESELFGHVKGAFTGAYKTRRGRFEAAQGGDIFLDEVGDLSLSMQVKLLRVLEENVIERVGENRRIEVDVRVISATNKDLKGLVDKGFFREDLFFRINVIPITMPPLRERIEDIPLLAENFFRRLQMKSGKNIEGISGEAMEKLAAYPWPGNVRELKSAFEYAFVSCQDSVIQPHHLPSNILWGKLDPEGGLRVSVNRDETKKRNLLDALEKAGGNQSEAARILGVSRVTVWNRIKKFHIDLRRGIGSVTREGQNFS